MDRTDDAQKIRVSWNALDVPALGLAGNAYSARITVIVDDDEMNLALGDTSVEFKDVDFTKDLTVSAALTIGKMVISDIAEADFTSGLPAPSFYGKFKALDSDGGVVKLETSGTLKEGADLLADDNGLTLKSIMYPNVKKAGSNEDMTYGEFYYLGFNAMFDNWYVTTKANSGTRFGNFGIERPATHKFRVGLRHGAGDGVMPADADFDHFRITVEDSNGDLLGYNAQTVDAASRYDSVLGIVLGISGPGSWNGALCLLKPDADPAPKLTNVRLSNQVSDGPRAPYWDDVAGNCSTAITAFVATDQTRSFANPDGWPKNLGGTARWPGGAQGNQPLTVNADDEVITDSATAVPQIFHAPHPDEYYDFPVDVFDSDGNYTFKAWAEDDDGVRISPQSSVTLNVHYRTASENSGYRGYTDAGEGPRSFRIWSTLITENTATGVTPTKVTVYNLSIQSK